eukprot:TRINITY_DN70054_c0_g1_i1.p1 TRINITY_DN70054_c0_g1~~TRINITY_DN70054_c0_g1_i1.p1  ORF type:complete len:341 (-),score=32.86 TRINITY_DN70054_c0_g1_i1:62-934(-)
MRGSRPLPIQVAEYPRIYVYDDVFSDDEISELILRAETSLRPAYTMSPDGASNNINRNKRDADFTEVLPEDDSSTDIVRVFRRALSTAALAPENHGEYLSVSRYRRGQKYELHFDSSLTTARYVTALGFLRSPAAGGELMFPWAYRGQFANVSLDGIFGRGRSVSELKGVTKEPHVEPLCREARRRTHGRAKLDDAGEALMIMPKAGRVVIFFTHDPQLRRVSYAGMHASCPVESDDEKIITQLWIKWHSPNRQNLVSEVLTSVGMSRWQHDVLHNGVEPNVKISHEVDV